MTDRHAGYVVTLERNVREDDAQVLISALRMIRGVESVTPVTASLEIAIATERARADLRERVWSVFSQPAPETRT